jgi:hypothetical protein
VRAVTGEFAGRDRPAKPPDKVEIWARRTGRVLGYAALFVLALYLLVSYGPR